LRTHTIDQPEVHAAVTAMRGLTDQFGGDRVLIGEAYLPLLRLMAYYGGAGDGFHLPFNFHLMTTPWRADAIAALVEAYEAQLPAHGWPNWVLGNHDRSRLATRVGPAQAKVAAMLLLTLRGTPTIYQGEELGMTDVAIPAEAVRDPWELNQPGCGVGRDPVRTPMPWSGARNAGFSAAQPWLPLNPDWSTTNAAVQNADPASMLSFYRALLSVRRAHRALTHGAYRKRIAGGDILVFERACGAERVVIALNLGPHVQRVDLPTGEVLLSTSSRRCAAPQGELDAHEGLILRPL
jgi:alpha-glucosidase